MMLAQLFVATTLAVIGTACIASDFTRWRQRRNAAAIQVEHPGLSPEALAWAKLNESLNETQRFTLRHFGWFEITSSTGHRWRIGATGYIGNCFRYSVGGIYAKQYCAHLYPADEYPLADHLLAQALWIQTDEAGFRDTAN
jgi:hypothetical protein